MKTTVRSIVLAAFALGLPLGALAQALPYGPPISLDMAKKVAAGAEAEARKNNLTVVIAIVDAGGTLTYLERIDGTQLSGVEVAIGKARSANNYRRSTKVFEDAVAGGRHAVLGLPGALPIEGGIPLVADGKIVGAIGISGGSAAQDGQVAAAGVAVLQAK